MGSSSSKQPYPPFTVPYGNQTNKPFGGVVDPNVPPKNIADMHQQVMTVLQELDKNNKEVGLRWFCDQTHYN